MVNRVPLLVAVTDLQRLGLPVERWARALFAGGVDIVQLREPERTPEEIETLAARFLSVAPDRARLQINGQVKIAQKLGCGVHLPERAGTVRPALFPASRSVHSVESAAASGGFDFVIAGHIFETSSKRGITPRGTAWLADVVRACSPPVIAIGGITAENAGDAVRSGASGIAVIGALTAASDPLEAARRLRIAIDNAWSTRTMQNQTTTIDITLNGKSAAVPTGSRILDLLREKDIAERLVVVELNGAIVSRSEFGERFFSAGDRVEIVHFVGGGA